MTESIDMVNTATKPDKFVLLDEILTVFNQMPPNNSMLEVRIPPDKCTVLNIAVTYHGEECQYILPDKEPPDRFKVLNITDYVIHNSQNTNGYHKFNTRYGVYVPLGIKYEPDLNLIRHLYC